MKKAIMVFGLASLMFAGFIGNVNAGNPINNECCEAGWYCGGEFMGTTVICGKTITEKREAYKALQEALC